MLSSREYMCLNSFSCLSHNTTTFSAKSVAPSPPFPQLSTRLKLTCLLSSISFNVSISFCVSWSNLFIATITFSPSLSYRFSICFSKFLLPLFKASVFSSVSSSFGIPP